MTNYLDNFWKLQRYSKLKKAWTTKLQQGYPLWINVNESLVQLEKIDPNMSTFHNPTIKKWLGLGLTCLSNKFTHILKIKAHFSLMVLDFFFGFFFFWAIVHSQLAPCFLN